MVLPILVTQADEAGSPYPVLPQWLYPGESIWSRLAKFALWNVLTVRELAGLMGLEDPDRDLRQLPNRNACKQLQHHLHVNGTSLSDAYPAIATWSDGEEAFDILRGCPTCFSQAFHSALFQLSWLSHCPIHKMPLLRGCPQCRFPIPYALANEAFRSPYQCARCGYGLCAELQNASPSQHVLLDTDFARLARWREYIEQCGTLQFVLWTLRPPPVLSAGLCDFLAQWQAHFFEPPLWGGGSMRRPHFQIDLPVKSKQRYDLLPAFKIVFRQVRRQLEAKLNRQDLIHFQRDAARELRAGRSVVLKQAPADVVAYIAWRVNWEEARTPPGVAQPWPTPSGLWRWRRELPAELEYAPQWLLGLYRYTLIASYSAFGRMTEWMKSQDAYVLHRCYLMPQAGLTWTRKRERNRILATVYPWQAEFVPAQLPKTANSVKFTSQQSVCH